MSIHNRDCESHLRETWKQMISRGVPSRRLEDRVRELCARFVTANDDEVELAIVELRSALREHNRRLRKLALAKLANPLSTWVRQPA